MKKLYLISITLFSIIMFFSCNKENENMDSRIKGSSNIMSVRYSNVSNSMLYTGPTKYAYLAQETDNESIISEHTINPLATIQSSVEDNQSSTQVECNSVLLSSSTNYYQNSFSSLYGNGVVFTIGNLNPVTIDMYIPERINFVSPLIVSNSDLYPFCYYDNFVLKWNADSLNDNGIVVIVEWHGEMYGEPFRENEHFRNVDILSEDDGIETLRNSIFDNIPEDAIATMTITRGEVEKLTYNKESWKVGGLTTSSLPFILVRDMSNYQ